MSPPARPGTPPGPPAELARPRLRIASVPAGAILYRIHRYRARHDDSGFSIALFERARDKVEPIESVDPLDPSFARELAGWLDRYGLGLTS